MQTNDDPKASNGRQEVLDDSGLSGDNLWQSRESSGYWLQVGEAKAKKEEENGAGSMVTNGHKSRLPSRRPARWAGYHHLNSPSIVAPVPKEEVVILTEESHKEMDKKTGDALRPPELVITPNKLSRFTAQDRHESQFGSVTDSCGDNDDSPLPIGVALSRGGKIMAQTLAQARSRLVSGEPSPNLPIPKHHCTVSETNLVSKLIFMRVLRIMEGEERRDSPTEKPAGWSFQSIQNLFSRRNSKTMMPNVASSKHFEGTSKVCSSLLLELLDAIVDAEIAVLCSVSPSNSPHALPSNSNQKRRGKRKRRRKVQFVAYDFSSPSTPNVEMDRSSQGALEMRELMESLYRALRASQKIRRLCQSTEAGGCTDAYKMRPTEPRGSPNHYTSSTPEKYPQQLIETFQGQNEEVIHDSVMDVRQFIDSLKLLIIEMESEPAQPGLNSATKYYSRELHMLCLGDMRQSQMLQRFYDSLSSCIRYEMKRVMNFCDCYDQLPDHSASSRGSWRLSESSFEGGVSEDGSIESLASICGAEGENENGYNLGKENSIYKSEVHEQLLDDDAGEERTGHEGGSFNVSCNELERPVCARLICCDGTGNLKFNDEDPAALVNHALREIAVHPLLCSLLAGAARLMIDEDQILQKEEEKSEGQILSPNLVSGSLSLSDNNKGLQSQAPLFEVLHAYIHEYDLNEILDPPGISTLSKGKKKKSQSDSLLTLEEVKDLLNFVAAHEFLTQVFLDSKMIVAASQGIFRSLEKLAQYICEFEAPLLDNNVNSNHAPLSTTGMVWLAPLADIKALRTQLAAETQTIQVLKVVLEKELNKLYQQTENQIGKKNMLNRIFRKANSMDSEDIMKYPQVQQICELDF